MNNEKVIEVLKGARKLLKEKGWIQHTGSSDSGLCILGAMGHYCSSNQCYDVLDRAKEPLLELSGAEFLHLWNDEMCRTKEEVIDLLDRAIELEKQTK